MSKINKKYLLEIEEKLTIPTGFHLNTIVEDIHQNGKSVLLVRYTKEEDISLLGEHFSVTVERNTMKILGFTHMDQSFVLNNQEKLPTEAETKKIAEIFLGQIEPGLFQRLNNLWMAQHDETILVNGQEQVVSGMKYKCYCPTTDDYAWVIVASNQEVITFEREIIWREGRVTEKWLHDAFLKKATL